MKPDNGGAKEQHVMQLNLLLENGKIPHTEKTDQPCEVEWLNLVLCFNNNCTSGLQDARMFMDFFSLCKV